MKVTKSEAMANADHGRSGGDTGRNRGSIDDRLVHRPLVVDIPDLCVCLGPHGQVVFRTYCELARVIR